MNHAKKRITRKQARAWLAPVRNALATMRTGEIEAVRGYPVTRLHWNDQWERVDWCCAGFRALINRLMPTFDTSPIFKIECKLANGAPLTIAELDSVLKALNAIETELLKFPFSAVRDAVLTEQINIEMEICGLKVAA